MALSLSFFIVCLLTLLPKGLHGATVTHDFDVGWVRANPDGMFERSVIGINGQWPPPMLNFTKGDRVIINLHNSVRVLCVLEQYVY
jgi:iron transport multicopper oxidase